MLDCGCRNALLARIAMDRLLLASRILSVETMPLQPASQQQAGIAFVHKPPAVAVVTGLEVLAAIVAACIAILALLISVISMSRTKRVSQPLRL